jgi:hypothetical protein
MPKKPTLKLPTPNDKPDRWTRISRALSSHIAVAAIATGVTASLTSERIYGEALGTLKTFQRGAVYAGCGHEDQLGNFAFNVFPTAINEETGEPYPKVKTKKR